MRHMERKITVVGEQNKPGAVFIETADGFEMLVLGWKQCIDRLRVALLAARADITGWLIEQKICEWPGHCWHWRAVQRDSINAARYAAAKLRRYAVHGHAAAGNLLVGFTA